MRSARALFLVASLACAGCASGVRAQQPAPAPMSPHMPPPPPAVITSAVGEARYTPDRANVQVAVQTRALTAAAAAAENARRQRAVFDTLRALGIPAEKLSTTGYSVQPEYRYERDGGTPQVTGYVVQNMVRAEVAVDQAGRVIDAALAKGANVVAGLEFFSSSMAQSRREALTAAVGQARADAEAMARAAGGSLGGLLELSSVEEPQGPRPMYSMRAEAATAQPATPITAGEETVRATVVARWAFVGPR